MAKKNFVLDTNVLLHDPAALTAFADNEVVLPFPERRNVDGDDAQFAVGEHRPGRGVRSPPESCEMGRR